MFAGPTYYEALAAFHRILKPATYLEIGVHQGHSLSLAGADTSCIGIDPTPDVRHGTPRDTTILATTSDDAFESGAVDEALAGRPIDLAFIDGLHLFEQALRDFANVEARCQPGSVILIHDCLPIDAVSSARERTTVVWSGDVWKVVPALRSARTDLRITTLDVPPTGLGVVTALDPCSTALAQRHAELSAEFVDQTYDDLLVGDPQTLLNVRPIDRTLDDAVALALGAR